MRSLFLVLFLSCVSIPSSLAYRLTERPLHENVKLADLVALATATSDKHDIDGLFFVTLRVDGVLKGKPISHIELLVTPTEVEQDPACCKAGAKYLALLKRIRDNQFESVNGYFAIRKLPY